MEITDPILMFSFIMFIILLAPVLFERMKLPGIVGLIVAGIIVGPHALKLLKPEGAIELLSSVGLIYIMFLAGLEINLNEFSRHRNKSLGFGSLTFFIPMLIGSVGGMALFKFSWPTAVLLASMFASHTLISFPITSRLGISRQRSVIAAVGGTIFTDTAALLVLAFIAEWVRMNITPVFMMRQLVLLVLLIWFAFWLLPRLARFFFRMLAPDSGAEFILILALVFYTSHLAYLAGVEPIIGAFFAGLALSRIISDQSPLMNRLNFVGNVLFIPFFLISVGMLVNLRALVSGWGVWAIAMYMVAAVIICKYAAAMLFARLMKYAPDEGRLIFGLSVTQAAATLAAVIVGMRLEIFTEAILNGTIVMIMATCVVGPYYTEKYGRRVALSQVSRLDQTGGLDRIMVAVGRDESVTGLTDVALELRPKGAADPLFPLFVIQDGEDVDRRIAAGEKMLSKIVARVVAAGVPVSPISRIDVSVHGGILHALKEWHIDTLVMGASRYRSHFRTMMFGVHHKISEESRQLLFLCNLTHPLNMDTQMILVVPPMLERQGGFGRAWEAVRNLASANKLSLRIVAVAETIKRMQGLVQKGGARPETAYTELGQGNTFIEYLQYAQLPETETIVLMTVRKGRLAWRPSMEGMYESIGRRFPRNNVIMIHPGDAVGADETEDAVSGDKNDDGVVGAFLTRPAIDITETRPEDAVRKLLSVQFADHADIVARLMEKLLPLDPLELTPVLALFHTHSADIGEPIVLLGMNRGDCLFPHMKKKAEAFFVLVSPQDQTAMHLQMLARIARLARDLVDGDSGQFPKITGRSAGDQRGDTPQGDGS